MTATLTTRQIAQQLYFQGFSVKDIADQLKISERTLRNWITKEAWKERRAAQQISRDAIVQRLLKKIDEVSQEENASIDKIIKLANSIERIEKKGSVADHMQTFLSFTEWLKQYQKHHPEIEKAFIVTLLHLQDTFINEKLNAQP